MIKRLELGKLYMTSSINNLMEKDKTFEDEILTALGKYMYGDWGDLCEEDKKMNNSAVKNNDDRILGKYKTSIDDIYIITEYDRSATTILFCDEY